MPEAIGPTTPASLVEAVYTRLPERVVKFAIRRPMLVTFGLGGIALTLLLWWTWWDRAAGSRRAG